MYKYVGRAWISGVPARDLTEEEVSQLDVDPAVLIESKLWVHIPDEPAEPPRRKKPARAKLEAEQTSEGASD